MNEVKFQIGKSGINQGILDSLKLTFKNHKKVRISVLKSACRDKEELKKMYEELREKLSEQTESRFEGKIIGYTIVLFRKKK